METTTPLRTFRLTLNTHEAAAFKEAMQHAGYDVEDTGERITTDAGVDAEQIIEVRAPQDACLSRADRIHALLRV